jgi:Raf kinase inhibitor-like YbhB/YbcL family protein
MSKWRFLLILVSCFLLICAGCAPAPDAAEEPLPVEDQASADEPEPTEAPPPPTEEEVMEEEEGDMESLEMSLTSPAFNDSDPIPTLYSCDGDDVSPDLDWFGIPEGTKSLALIMDDPDAPVGTWVHWVLFNIPADIPGLQQDISGVGVEGLNSWGRTGYGGPCPPGGTHRYFFKLYALDISLDLEEGADKAALLEAMEGHILGQAELMGTYTR